MEQSQVNALLIELTGKVSAVLTEVQHHTDILEDIADRQENHEHRITALETCFKTVVVVFSVLLGIVVWASRLIPSFFGWLKGAL